MIMFGFMFGDLGQGALFLIAGLLLAHKFHHPNLGGVLSRIGASSMLFGTLFGSVFGSEDVIKPLLFRPMDNINTVLLIGVALGVVFTTVSFIYNFVNSFKVRDIERGVFDKNGVVGLLFFWIILLTAISMLTKGGTPVPLGAIIAVLVILLALMVLKNPLSNLITGHRPLYDSGVSDYYVESSFGIVETLLSMLSNTISFVRVGAFTLNHVGLFIAFATLADMIKSSAGSVAVLVVGNIIVICLEGMVVFIQGLRLEYYELFSKYYDGAGVEYNPARLRFSYKPYKTPSVSINRDTSSSEVLYNAN
jgi:V/A-type H+-transporting ATPase subunit I